MFCLAVNFGLYLPNKLHHPPKLLYFFFIFFTNASMLVQNCHDTLQNLNRQCFLVHYLLVTKERSLSFLWIPSSWALHTPLCWLWLPSGPEVVVHPSPEHCPRKAPLTATRLGIQLSTSLLQVTPSPDMLGWFRCCWLGFLKQQLANYGPRDTGELKKADEFFRWKSEADIWQTRTIFKGCESFTEFKIIRCAGSEKSLADYTKHTIKWR